MSVSQTLVFNATTRTMLARARVETPHREKGDHHWRASDGALFMLRLCVCVCNVHFPTKFMYIRPQNRNGTQIQWLSIPHKIKKEKKRHGKMEKSTRKITAIAFPCHYH